MAGFDDYWKRLQARTPPLSDDETVMRITVASFQKSLRAAYHAGYEAGAELGGKVESLTDKIKAFTDKYLKD